MITAWLQVLVACGEVESARPGAGDSPLGDTGDTSTVADSGCADGEEAETRSATGADGRMASIYRSWQGVGFSGDLTGELGDEVLTWGEAFGDTATESVLSLFEVEEIKVSPGADPVWTMVVPSPDDDRLYIRSASASGDLNGDGTADLVLATNKHQLLVVSGPVDASTRPSDASLRIEGIYLGVTQAVVGDVDGDAVADLAAGMTSAVVLISPAGLSGDVEVTDAGPRVDFFGDRVGYVPEVAAAGDHDGDGLADLLVSTWNWSGLFLGPVGFGAEDSAAATFDGDDARGWRTASAADFDGDGHSDIVVGAPEADGGGSRGGAAWLVLGPVDGFVDLADAAAHVRGEGAYLNLGSAVSGAGDVDGDGDEELLLSAAARDCDGSPTVSCTGSAKVYRFLSPPRGALDLACADVVWEGENGTGDQFGESVQAGYDIDGSGLPDMVVSTDRLWGYLFLDP